MKFPMQDIPLLITSAVNVKAPNTKLSDSRERLHHTLEGLRQWMSSGAFRQIVVCDGSGFDLSPHLQALNASDSSSTVFFEALHFQNDIYQVQQRGKGYGEGQIVEHALAHSHILTQAESFAKCTAKLWVGNAVACLRHYNGTAAFNLAGGFTPVNVDTRFYICSRSFYDARLRGCHHSVDEARGQYLEHRFFASIQGPRMFRNSLRPTPVIVGISGSMGRPHQSSWRNNLVKDVRNAVLRLAGR